jgi:hypothetical protein
LDSIKKNKNMKKITLTSIAGIAIGTMMFAFTALAATTALITPTSVKVVAGQQFNVVVSVNPNGTSDYAEQLQIDYPANLLQVTAFNIGSSWMSLSQPGYDSIDNTNGVLIKTAGYTGGITSLTPFGTITFTAKNSGSAPISIGSGSKAFEKTSQSAITGTGAEATIVAAVVAPKIVPAANTAPKATTTDLTPVTTINGQVATATNAQVAAAAVAASQSAVGSSSSSAMTIVWIIIAIIIIAVIVFLIYKKKVEKSV